MVQVHIVGNPRAAGGRNGAVASRVRGQLRRLGHDAVEVRVETPADAAAALAGLRCTGGRVVLVGGDGLVHLAVQELAGSAVEVGLVPGGTGNDFARALGIPLDDPAEAVDRALAPAVPVDAIRCGDRWVASVSMVGFSVAVNARANRLRWPRGGRRYTIATLRELPGLTPVPLTVDVDGTRHEVEATLLTVANTAYFGGGMAISPEARADDGLLDVTAIGPVGRLELLRVFPKVFDGSHVAHPAVTLWRGARIGIDGAGEHWGDGEPVGHLPAVFEAVPGALHIAGATP